MKKRRLYAFDPEVALSYDYDRDTARERRQGLVSHWAQQLKEKDPNGETIITVTEAKRIIEGG